MRYYKLEKIGKQKANSYAKYYNEEPDTFLGCYETAGTVTRLPEGTYQCTISPIFVFVMGRVFHETASGYCKGDLKYIREDVYEDISS